jgi:hypothetical protein
MIAWLAFWAGGVGGVLAIGPFRVHICWVGAEPKADPVAWLRCCGRQGACWQAWYDANEGSPRLGGGGGGGGGGMLLSLLEGPQREARGPLQIQVAVISLPAQAVMTVPWAVLTEMWRQEEQTGPMLSLCLPENVLRNYLQDQHKECCSTLSPLSSLTFPL